MLAKMEHVVPRHAGGRRGDRRRLNALLSHRCRIFLQESAVCRQSFSFKAGPFHFMFGPFNFKIQPFNLML